MTATATPSAAPSQSQVQQQARSDAEQQRRDAERQARDTIDQEAASAIDETRKAIDAISSGKTAEAIAAIERATGTIDVLVSRNPEAALLPVAAASMIIDTAPRDFRDIRDIAETADAAMLARDFPLARLLLGMLASEIRVRTFHLPLATYPIALREAARLLDQNQTDNARAVLEAALTSLVVIDRIIPLPVVLARVAIEVAESYREQDRDAATRLLDFARDELDRAVELGYSGDDDEYKALSRSISDLQKQLKGNENTTSAFAKLRERMAAFVRRLSEGQRNSQTRKKSRSDRNTATSEQRRGTSAAAR